MQLGAKWKWRLVTLGHNDGASSFLGHDVKEDIKEHSNLIKKNTESIYFFRSIKSIV